MRNALMAARVAVIGLATAVPFASATVYNGNAAGGFGGGIGNSAITVTDGGATVNFSITSTSSSFDGNPLVLYFDTVAGGDASTSTYTDIGDTGRRVVSGLSDNGRSLVTFPVGFGSDRGVAIEIGSFAGLFNTSTPGNFGFLASGGISGTGLGPITFSFNKADLGLPSDGSGYSFQFVGSLISGSAYRSNETYGTSVTTPGTAGDTPNGGFTGTQAFAAANTFTFVPEPASLGLLAVGAVGLLRRRK